ncbi:MAG: metal ABC transporter permease [Candidatus Eisenbacteria bacterium]
MGSLFTVAPEHIAKTAILYAVIGLAHFLLRRPFFEITDDASAAHRRGRSLFAWDFLFYGLFGFVVTSSVQIAGVLLVFGLLVIPAVAGLITTRSTGMALLVGWSFAGLACIVGLFASVRFDFPAAPSILVSPVHSRVARRGTQPAPREDRGDSHSAAQGASAMNPRVSAAPESRSRPSASGR